MKGTINVLEGVNGVGKTTVAKLIVEYFKQQGAPVEYLRSPGGSDFGESLRGILGKIKNPRDVEGFAKQLVYTAAQRQWIREVARPLLEKGTHIIADRGSWIAGQVYGGFDGLTMRQAETLHELFWVENEDVLSRCNTIIMTAAPTVMIKRIEGREEQTVGGYHVLTANDLADLQGRYMALANKNGYSIVDANGPVEEVSARVMSILLRTVSL